MREEIAFPAGARRALEDARQVLTSPDVEGVVNRDVLLPVVDRVVCHKDGLEVVFAPGFFESETEAGGGDQTVTRPALA